MCLQLDISNFNNHHNQAFLEIFAHAGFYTEQTVKLPSFRDNHPVPPLGIKQSKTSLEKFVIHRLIFR